MISENERSWAMLIHLSGISVVSMIPGASILAPFLIWMVRKGESSWIDENARNVLNFQISWGIGTLVLLAFAYILSFILIGFLLYPFVGVLVLGNMVLSLYGGFQAYKGKLYHYPASFPFIV